MLGRTLRQAPPTLLFVFGIFAFLPLLSILTIGLPWHLFTSNTPLTACLLLFGYWVGPIAICTTLLKRSFALLFAFIFECAAIVALTIVNFEGFDQSLQIFQLSLIGLMTVLGVFIINKDILAPFLASGSRFWRSSSRIYVNEKVTIVVPGTTGPTTVDMMMQDCSLVGIGAIVSDAASVSKLGVLKKGMEVEVSLPKRTALGAAQMHVVWTRTHGSINEVGFSTRDTQFMSQLMKATDFRHSLAGGRFSQYVAVKWSTSAVRRTVLVIWGLTVCGTVATPACGRLEHSSHRGGGHTSATAKGQSSSHGFGGDLRFPNRPGFGLGDDGMPAVAYTGKSLQVSGCSDGSNGWLGDIWSQHNLLKRYQGNTNYFNSYINSLQNSGDGVSAPISPVHPNLFSRLGAAATDDGDWVLNLVRFRPDHIKLNYELNRTFAAADPSIAFAAFIYGVSIQPGDIDEYFADVLALNPDSNQIGCQVLAILNKYIDAKKGSLFFVHSNIFDTSTGINEWRWTEGKVIDLAASSQPMGMMMMPTPTITDRYNNPAGTSFPTRKLLVAPMSFPRFVANTDGTLSPSLNGPVTMWFSGNQTDQGIDLIMPVNGVPLATNDPRRAVEDTMTCAQCHAEKVGPTLNSTHTALTPVRDHQFRHVGFGEDEPFGLIRDHGRASFSQAFEQMLSTQTQAMIKGSTYACDGSEGFQSLQSHVNSCANAECHGSAAGGRIKLVTQDDWQRAVEAAYTYVELGLMPQGGSRDPELARLLYCWRAKVVPKPCTATHDFATEVQPKGQQYCSNCHNSNHPERMSLVTYADWKAATNVAGMLIGTSMPPAGSPGAGTDLSSFQTAVECLK